MRRPAGGACTILTQTNGDPSRLRRWVQVARQGNPLFNEGLVAIADKDLYSRTSPTQDGDLFEKYALNAGTRAA